jgi:hypothetical protein
MAEPVTLQQILNRFPPPEPLDPQRAKVRAQLLACRTEALGGRWLRCAHCQEEQRWYHSCRNRHCPQCQGRATRQWADRQQDDVLPVRYFHLVFTLPHTLNGWVALHPEVIYRRLFQAAWNTIKAFGADPRRLGGELGMTSVLHTWGENLSRHVHLHCLVPGGALDASGRWRSCRGNYLFPVRALARHFRGRMVALLRQAAERGELLRVTRAGEVDTVLDALMAGDWVVYTKDCLDHTDAVVRYLARYTHRIAISNARLVALDQGQVAFHARDYRDGGRIRTLRLEGAEFVRRFLLHVLPKGLMRIRHFGWLANRSRRTKLAQIRQVLATPPPPAPEPDRNVRSANDYPCPCCRVGRLQLVAQWPPRRLPARPSG